VRVADKAFNQIRESYRSKMFLGFICTYYVPASLRFSIGEWIIRADASGLKGMTPHKPRAVDAFKRAAAKAAENRKIREGIGNEFTYKFLVRDTGGDATQTFRSLIVEQLDNDENCLNYGEAVRFRFNRESERIDKPQLDLNFLAEFPEGLQYLVQDKADDVLRRYEQEVETLNDTKVRELIRGVLTTQSLAIPIRPIGQPYFVINFRDEDSPYNGNYERLQALDKFINGDDGGIPGCSFHWAPLVDDEVQREFVRQSFLDETTDSVGTFMNSMAQMLSGLKPLTNASVDVMLRDYERLGSKVEAYQGFLQDELKVATSELKMMFQQIGRASCRERV